ncbi:MAG: protein kinase [archaeon]|nr:protein kinase [archaeon]
MATAESSSSSSGIAPKAYGDGESKYAKVRELAKGGGGTVWLCRENKLKKSSRTLLVDEEEEGEEAPVATKQEPGDGDDDNSTSPSPLQPDASGRLVAVKKCKAISRDDGLNPSALREIRLLKELRHPNVIEIVDAYSRGSNLYIVFELMYEDLENIIRDKNMAFTAADVKGYLVQALRGVDYLHSQYVMHRDLKPANCLLDKTGHLKLTDFGLARVFGSPNRRYTREVQTIWYRAPELIFGCPDYTQAIDMWSVGCTFAELLLRKAFLPGETEIDQLSKMCAALGTPSERNWPGVSSLPFFVEFEEAPAPPLNIIFTAASSTARHLLQQMLIYDPTRRITAKAALEHPYYRDPLPTPPERLPLPRGGILDRKQNSAPSRFADVKQEPASCQKKLF